MTFFNSCLKLWKFFPRFYCGTWNKKPQRIEIMLVSTKYMSKIYRINDYIYFVNFSQKIYSPLNLKMLSNSLHTLKFSVLFNPSFAFGKNQGKIFKISSWVGNLWKVISTTSLRTFKTVQYFRRY